VLMASTKYLAPFLTKTKGRPRERSPFLGLSFLG
jgi:hypothetical protein